MTFHRLAWRGVEAVVSSRAAALRLLRVDGIDLVEPTLHEHAPPGMSGAVLAPWPNRVEGATWWQAGREHRLEVTEPEFGHANHGLLATAEFEAVRIDDRTLELRATIADRPGYPFRLDVRTRYRLRRDGVQVRIGVRNRGSHVAPVALGAHPYVRVGDTVATLLRVRIDADTIYRLDGGHIPRGSFAVDGVDDLRGGRPLPQVPRHATYAQLGRRRGLRHALTAPDGRTVEVHADAAYRWTQLYVDEAFPGADGVRTAVAVEPMTAPPNALRSGTGLRWLRPGGEWMPGFTIRLRHARPLQGVSRAR